MFKSIPLFLLVVPKWIPLIWGLFFFFNKERCPAIWSLYINAWFFMGGSLACRIISCLLSFHVLNVGSLPLVTLGEHSSEVLKCYCGRWPIYRGFYICILFKIPHIIIIFLKYTKSILSCRMKQLFAVLGIGCSPSCRYNHWVLSCASTTE